MRRIYRLLDPNLQDFATATEARILRFPQRFAREGQHYLDNANTLLLSRMSGKKWFFKCGLLKHTCKKLKVCPYCAQIAVLLCR
jgi:hypothetical protein